MNENESFGSLNINYRSYKTRLSKKFLQRKPYQPFDPQKVLSFIPGTVIDILVKEGQTVKKGDNLIILDAMKMQNKLKSIMDGTVKKINVKKGDKVSRGTLLLELK